MGSRFQEKWGYTARDRVRVGVPEDWGYSIRVTSPFSTALPLRGQTSQILSSLSPKRDCGSKRVKIKVGVGVSEYWGYWVRGRVRVRVGVGVSRGLGLSG